MLVIGSNNLKIAVPMKIKEKGWQQPIATKTHLEWTPQGGNNSRSTDFRLSIHTCAYQKNYNDRQDRVKNYFNIESSTSSILLSTADSDAMELLRTTCKKINALRLVCYGKILIQNYQAVMITPIAA